MNKKSNNQPDNVASVTNSERLPSNFSDFKLDIPFQLFLKFAIEQSY